MFSKATIAAATLFLLGVTQATPVAAVRSNFFLSLLTPNFPAVAPLVGRDPDPSSPPTQGVTDVVLAPNTSPNVPIDQSFMALIALGDGFDYDFACNPYSDYGCYKRWWDYYRYCHPYDRKCYRDCDNYDDYYGSCKNYNRGYGTCYDRCYYDGDSCDKYLGCYDDNSCYRRRRREDYCYPKYDERYDEHCRDRHEPPYDYCKPYDYECHRKNPNWKRPGFGMPGYPHKPGYPDKPDYGKPGYPDKPDYGKPGYPDKPDYGKPGYPDKPKYPEKPEYPDYPNYPDHPDEPKYPDQPDEDDDYFCYPGRDKDCYPGIPDFPDYDDDYDDDYTDRKPKKHVIVKFFNKKKGLLYEEKVWPQGEEKYIEHKNVPVEYIKYYTEDEKHIRCLAMKNWFPWHPLPIYKYKEKKDSDGYVVRTLILKKRQPVEVVRCDYL